MDDKQTATPEQLALEAVEAQISAEKLLKLQQEWWIDYNAVGGLLLEADGSFKKSPLDATRKYTISDFARDIQVDRSTLYRWNKQIPNFWDRVRDRRKVLGGEARVQKVWNGVFLKASAGNPQAAALYLANFDEDFRMPTEKIQHEAAGSLLDVLERARNTQKDASAITEGEVVEPTNQA